MIVETTRFGNVEIDEKKVIKIPEGILGFSEYKDYFLVDHKDTPFKWLQSIDNPELAFIMIDPLLFEPDYRINITKNEISCLKISDPKEVLVMAIVSIHQNPDKITANLQGPLVINVKKMLAKQIVLAEERYTTRHSIVSQMKKYAACD